MTRALRHRNFRLYFSGQLVSLIGTWMQQVAMGWLVYRLTGSVFLLGLLGFASQIPVLLFAPFGGVISDRYDRHRLLVLTQTLAMVQALILAALTLGGWVQVWHLVLMASILGLINAVDAPVRQSFVVLLVEDQADRPNAIALNSLAMNSTRLVGPALAGAVIGLVGEGMCFLLNGLSYLAVLVALLLMNPPRHPRRAHSLFGGLKEGLDYAVHHRPIRALLSLAALVSVMVVPYVVLMPYYAKVVFHGDAHTLGLLMACSGLGAMTASLFLASRKSVAALSRHVPAAAGVGGAALMAFAFSTNLWLSMSALVVAGFGVIATAAGSNTLIQTLVEERFRGRVMSLFTVAFLGMAPVGNLLSGAIAHYVGVPATLFGGGVLALGVGRMLARPIAEIRVERAVSSR